MVIRTAKLELTYYERNLRTLSLIKDSQRYPSDTVVNIENNGYKCWSHPIKNKWLKKYYSNNNTIRYERWDNEYWGRPITEEEWMAACE